MKHDEDVLWVRRLCRMGLYAFFSAGTILLAGSLSPERLVRHGAGEHPALPAIRQMASELPVERQASWLHAAEKDPVAFFRISCSGR